MPRFLPVCLQTQPEEGLGLFQLIDEGVSWLQVICCDQLNPPQRSATILWIGTFPNRNGKVHCHQLQRTAEKKYAKNIAEAAAEKAGKTLLDNFQTLDRCSDKMPLCQSVSNSETDQRHVTREMAGGNIYPP